MPSYWIFITKVTKTSRRNCFLERTNRECIIDRFGRVIHTAHSFVESQAKLLNAYNEPGIIPVRSLPLMPIIMHLLFSL